MPALLLFFKRREKLAVIYCVAMFAMGNMVLFIFSRVYEIVPHALAPKGQSFM